MSRFNRLLEALDRFGAVYEDIEILAHEYVTTAPTVKADRVNRAVADWALQIVRREADARPRVAAAACVTVGKFGIDLHLDELQGLFRTWRQDTVLRTQATVILLATGRLTPSDVSALLARSQLETIENQVRHQAKSDLPSTHRPIGCTTDVARRRSQMEDEVRGSQPCPS